MKHSKHITNNKNSLLERITSVVHRIEPTAELALYGSQARGEATPESDWDILILLEGEVSHKRKVSIWDALYLLELETDESIGTTIKSRTEWETNPILHSTGLYQNLHVEAFQF
jgi:uncharacterized protein